MATSVQTTLDFTGGRIVNLPAPTAAGDAANKSYVDSAVEGMNWKDSVRVASPGSNINLAAPGATINGITMVLNDRVLVKDQTAGAENGIYIWNGAAVPMTRSLDTNIFDELEQAIVSVEEGTSASSTFRQTAVNGTIGTTPVVWTSFGVATPAATESTAGIAELATQAETDGGTDDLRIVTPLKLANWSGRKRKIAQTIGDGSATSYAVTHSFNTRDVDVAVYRNSGNYDRVIVDIEYTDVNTVTIKFGTAPASNAYRVVVLG